MRTPKAQISRSGQGLRCPLTEKSETTEWSNGEQMPRWDFAHVQDNVNPHILRMLAYARGHFFFLFDATPLILDKTGENNSSHM